MQLFRRRTKTPEKTSPRSIYDLAREVKDRFEEVAHPSELLGDTNWNAAVAAVRENELQNYALAENNAVASLALAAIGARGDDAAVSGILAHMNEYRGDWTKFFALHALDRLVPAPRPLLGRLFAALDDDWSESYERFLRQFIRELVKRRLAAGEAATFAGALEPLGATRLDHVRKLLDVLDRDLVAPFRDELETHRRGRVDIAYLKSIGTVWTHDPAAPVAHAALEAGVATIERTLTAARRRSLVLVGEEGVGKTTLIRAAAQRLRASGWTIFEAGGPEIAAGMSYVGEIEERVQRMVKEAGGGRRVLWIVPRLHELMHAGAHRHNPRGILDWILPEIAAGSLVVVAEDGAAAYQRLVQQCPSVQSAFVALRVDPLDEEETLELARRWNEALDHDVLSEAWKLTQQYLGMRAAPGNLLALLQRAASDGHAPTMERILAALAQLTGLPGDILDERAALDLDALRAHFAARVIGQEEAVDVLVERMAMIKAGLTDPARPFGVFLFAGPTGTGKTEAAKTLAAALFGSSERMIRLDMSEFKESDSLARLLGDASGEASSLVDAIRKQPFAVVLLDELEKAHPNVWDLFLQLFDDGRLTDRRGVTGDFRQAVVIMTTNAGVASGQPIGFGDDGLKPATTRMKEFRREFLNRIDRIVVFRPLERATMRRILRKEIALALGRRGLRNRQWRVEVDASAVDFLLDAGFTPDLGARPLKRAVERHLLTPLAEMIVTGRVPRGDQRIVVRAEGGRVAIEIADAAYSRDDSLPGHGRRRRRAEGGTARPRLHAPRSQR